MMQDYLRARFVDDGDGTGELIARVEANGFCAESRAYFNVAEIEAFARLLASFPLPATPPPAISGGYWSKDGRSLEQEHLGITAYPVGPRGQVGLQVRLATPVSGNIRALSQNSATIELLTTYEALSRFSGDLARLVRGALHEVVLLGEELA